MKSVLVLLSLVLSVVASGRASAGTVQGWLADLFAADQNVQLLVQTFAVTQSFQRDQVACDFKNLKVLKTKGVLNSTIFEAEIACSAIPSADATVSTEIVEIKGYVEDSQIFPTRVEIKR